MKGSEVDLKKENVGLCGPRAALNCAFCRTPFPDSDSGKLAMIQARVGKRIQRRSAISDRITGTLGLQKDTRKAAELYSEAAKLGSVEALLTSEMRKPPGKGFKRTGQKLQSSTKKRPC